MKVASNAPESEIPSSRVEAVQKPMRPDTVSEVKVYTRNQVSRRFILGAGGAALLTSFFGVFGLPDIALGQDAEISPEEFEKRLREAVDEFIEEHKHEVIDGALPTVPSGIDAAHPEPHGLTDEDVDQVIAEAHAVSRQRESFADDPAAIEGRENLTLAGDIIGAGAFGHAIYKWIKGEQISIKHYGAILVSCALKYNGANDEKEHHLIDEWSSSTKSFLMMLFLGSIFKGEYFKGMDFSNYSDQQIAFVMTTLSHLIAPLNTTFGAATIMSPLLRDQVRRWKLEGLEDKEIHKRVYRLFVHTPNLAGVLGIGDYPFLRVVQELGWKKLVPWQVGSGFGVDSLTDEYLASLLYQMYQMAPSKMNPAQKLAWAIGSVRKKENWSASYDFFTHLVPLRSLANIPVGSAKRLLSLFKGVPTETTAPFRAAVREAGEDFREFRKPFMEDIAAFGELMEAILTGDTTEVCRCALMEVFKPGNVYDSVREVGEKEMGQDSRNTFWDTLHKDAHSYDESARDPFGDAELHVLSDIVIELREELAKSSDGLKYHELMQACIDAFEAKVAEKKEEGKLGKAYQFQQLEFDGIAHIRNSLYGTVLQSDEFWKTFQSKVDEEHHMKEGLVEFIQKISGDGLKVEELIHKLASGSLKLHPKTIAQFSNAMRENQLAVAATTLAEDLTNVVLPEDIEDPNKVKYPTRLAASFAYFFNPKYIGERLAPFVGETLAEMIGVLPMQIASIAPVVDLLTRSEVFLDGLSATVGKTRARVYYAAIITWVISGVAENYTGFSIGCESLKKLLGPMLGKNPYQTSLEDPDLKPLFTVLYFISIIGGYSNLLGDFGPHMAFISQIVDKKKKFPSVLESAKANVGNDVIGWTIAIGQMEMAIRGFNEKLAAHEAGAAPDNASTMELDEEVMRSLSEYMLAQLKKKYDGQEMPAQAQTLVKQLETFLHNRDEIFSEESLKEHVPGMELESTTDKK